MAELIRAYTKDISLVVEFRLSEVLALLDFMDKATATFDSTLNPEFVEVSETAKAVLHELDMMCEQVRKQTDGS